VVFVSFSVHVVFVVFVAAAPGPRLPRFPSAVRTLRRMQRGRSRRETDGRIAISSVTFAAEEAPDEFAAGR